MRYLSRILVFLSLFLAVLVSSLPTGDLVLSDNHPDHDSLTNNTVPARLGKRVMLPGVVCCDKPRGDREDAFRAALYLNTTKLQNCNINLSKTRVSCVGRKAGVFAQAIPILGTATPPIDLLCGDLASAAAEVLTSCSTDDKGLPIPVCGSKAVAAHGSIRDYSVQVRGSECGGDDK